MSHGDSVSVAPPASWSRPVRRGAVAAFEDPGRRLAGVQFHPEVLHSQHGQAVLERFLYEVAGCSPSWTMTSVIDEQVERIRAQVGTGRVVCGLSGGVDSAVAAALVQRAVGEQLTCVFVDHGLLRKARPSRSSGTTLQPPASARRRRRARAVPHGARGRQRPGDEAQDHRPRVHPRVEDAARGVIQDAGAHGESVDFLVQGTLYPDVVESGGARAPPTSRATQRGRPARRHAVRPGRAAARPVQGRGAAGGPRSRLPPEIVWRHPFPGPGLAIRIVGAVSEDRLAILREADAIAREELTAAGSTATCGSSRSCCWPMSGRWACRATAYLRPSRRAASRLERGRQ